MPELLHSAGDLILPESCSCSSCIYHPTESNTYPYSSGEAWVLAPALVGPAEQVCDGPTVEEFNPNTELGNLPTQLHAAHGCQCKWDSDTHCFVIGSLGPVIKPGVVFSKRDVDDLLGEARGQLPQWANIFNATPPMKGQRHFLT